MRLKTVQECLSRYRSELKGLAILWVVFFHMKMNLSGVLGTVLNIGYGGVDIFFFLSGFGLFHSLHRCDDLGIFYRKRAVRILPAYFPVCLLWLIVSRFLYDFSISDRIRIIAGNLTMLGFFAEVPITVNWYISALVMSIILAPLFYRIIVMETHRVRNWIGLLAFSFVLGLAFLHKSTYMAVSRLPVFLLGMMACAWNPAEKENKENRQVKRIAFFSAVMLFLGLAVLIFCMRCYPTFLNAYAMYWHPFALIAPSLCILLSLGFSKIPKNEKILLPIRKLGEASYEIFLWNVFCEMICNALHVSRSIWVIAGLASVIAGYLYHLLILRLGKKQKMA